MTTEEFRELVDQFYKSQAELAREIDTAPQTVNAWYKGRQEPPKSVMLYLQGKTEIVRLKERLAAIDSVADAFREWLAPSCDQ